MKKELNWRYLKGLHVLYKEGKTRNKLMNNSYIKNVLFRKLQLVAYANGNMDIIESKAGFKSYFEKELLEQYNYYYSFFENAGLESSAMKKHDEYDLQTLMYIHRNNEELKKSLTTLRIFSSNVFKQKDSKYLETKKGLLKDVLSLLGIEEFPKKDPKENQSRHVADCPNPQHILLCENHDFLKVPWEFGKENIELWYVGGNNTKILNEISERYLNLPIHYVCDWDYAGLKIYQDIVAIFKKKEKEVKLIYPTKSEPKPINSGNHKSKWRHEGFSKLKRDYYTNKEAEMIEKLIATNTWIEEQTIEPIEEVKR